MLPMRRRLRGPLLFTVGFVLTSMVTCSRLPDMRDAVEAMIQRPAIEVTVHAGDAAKVRSLASRGHGTLDLAAVTLGSVIFYIDAAPSEELRRHEFCHVRQMRREGVLFPVNYWTENALHGYAGSRYENECRAAEADPSAPTADADR